MKRYLKQINFDPLGQSGQEKLKNGSILIVGVGALGSVMLSVLGRAGVGHIRIVDDDVVTVENLHRQFLYTEEHAGRSLTKVAAAKEMKASINSDVRVEAIVDRFVPRNADMLASGVDLILDATDNFETRLLINDVALSKGLPWVYSGVVGSCGRSASFSPTGEPCFRCYMDDVPPEGVFPTIDTAGIIGPVVSMISSASAADAIRILTGQPMYGKMRIFDVWDHEYHCVKIHKNHHCVACVEHNYQYLNKE